MLPRWIGTWLQQCLRDCECLDVNAVAAAEGEFFAEEGDRLVVAGGQDVIEFAAAREADGDAEEVAVAVARDADRPSGR